MPPKLVIDLARRKGLDGIAVTDHDTIDGALATVRANRHPDFLVIPGIEVKSDIGDIIGLYIDRQIESRRFAEVIEEIHAKGGLTYVPHPIRTFGSERTKRIHAAHPDLDLWEMYNGRYEKAEFATSRDTFEELGIVASLCGSDAHFPWDVGVFRTVLTDVPRDAQTLLRLSRDAKLQAIPRGELALSSGITLGAMTKAFKRGEYMKAGQLIAGLPFKALKKSVRIAAGRSQ